MASRAAITQLDLSDADRAKAWLMAFPTTGRAKKWTNRAATVDPPVAASFEITDNFMAVCGVEALQDLQYVVAPNKLENMAFAEIEKMILVLMKPKQWLVIAERTRFYIACFSCSR